jgi:CRP-like cAMP-binding protein
LSSTDEARADVRRSSSTSIDKLLSASRMFGGLPKLTRRLVAAQSVRITFQHGDRVYRAGERAWRFTSIVSGVVKLVRPIADGTETISGLYGPRESIGAPAVLERGNYVANAVVASPTAEILAVDAGPLLVLSRKSPEIAGGFTRVLLDHARTMHEKVGVMSAGSVTKRLATLLLAISERFGDECEDGSLIVPVPLSRSELACFIGARTETTIRTMRRWECRGVLETHAFGFSIRDTRALIVETRSVDKGA